MSSGNDLGCDPVSEFSVCDVPSCSGTVKSCYKCKVPGMPLKVELRKQYVPEDQLLGDMIGFDRTFRCRDIEQVEEEICKAMDPNSRTFCNSSVESISWNFWADGISRACSHQLVRHRIGSSFVGMTSRGEFCLRPNGPAYNIPPSMKLGPRSVYIDQMTEQAETYIDLIQSGVPSEDARYILGQGFNSIYAISMTHRTMQGFCNARMCYKAQWEVRLLANVMAYLIEYAGYPKLAAQLTPPCFKSKSCSWENVPDNGPDACPIFAEQQFVDGEYALEDHLVPEPCLPDTQKVHDEMALYLEGE